VNEAFYFTLLHPVPGGKVSEHLKPLQHTYEHLPIDSNISQLLVNKFCDKWAQEKDDVEDMVAQREIPVSFILGVMWRFSEK
jgi:hypothetical protein